MAAGDPLLGTTLDGRYAIEGVVGEGGMGTVYRAKHVTLGRALAVKVLRTDLAQDAELSARFLQEAQATAAIKHPNVVAITDFGRVQDGRPYFVMELLKGQTLATRIKEGRLDVLLATNVAMAIARGLGAAHAARVVHRDLKPENVFLLDDQAKELRVVDFGAALIVGASRLTKAGVVFGTPHYMSPEQAAGKTVDHRADIYALGIILYEMLTGRVPFEDDTYMGVLTQHMFAAPRPPSEVRQLAGTTEPLGAVEGVVLRALEKDPNDRFASMADLESALSSAVESHVSGGGDKTVMDLPRRHDDGLPTLDEIRTTMSSSSRHAERGDRTTLIAVGVVALVVGVASVIVGTRVLGGTPSPAASVPSANATVMVTAVQTTPSIPPPPSETPATTTTTSAPPPATTTAKPPQAIIKPRPRPTSTFNGLPPDPFQ